MSGDRQPELALLKSARAPRPQRACFVRELYDALDALGEPGTIAEVRDALRLTFSKYLDNPPPFKKVGDGLYRAGYQGFIEEEGDRYRIATVSYHRERRPYRQLAEQQAANGEGGRLDEAGAQSPAPHLLATDGPVDDGRRGTVTRVASHPLGCECAPCTRARHRWDRDAERAIHLFWCSRRRYPTLEETARMPDPSRYSRHCDYLAALECWQLDRRNGYVDHTRGAHAPDIEP